MTAGSGLLHIETPPESLVVSGGLFHGLQLWVNLPSEQKWAAPRYQDLRAGEIALLSSDDGGALLRVIAGDLGGSHRPRRDPHPDDDGRTRRSARARSSTLPWRPDFNALVYVLAGNGTVGTDRRPVRTGQLAVFGAGDTPDRRRGDGAGRAAARSSRSCCSAGGRSASRWPGRARSS